MLYLVTVSARKAYLPPSVVQVSRCPPSTCRTVPVTNPLFMTKESGQQRRSALFRFFLCPYRYKMAQAHAALSRRRLPNDHRGSPGRIVLGIVPRFARASMLDR